MAWLIGCLSEVTVLHEGVSEELASEEIAKYERIYFEAFLDGPDCEQWAGHNVFCGAAEAGKVLGLLSGGEKD